jgi:hypothetical protein
MGSRLIDRFVRAYRFGNLLAYRVDRIKGQARFLKNHRGRAAAIHLEAAAFQCQHILAIDFNMTTDARRALRMQAQQRAQGHAFAGTGFTQQAQYFACLQNRS